MMKSLILAGLIFLSLTAVAEEVTGKGRIADSVFFYEDESCTAATRDAVRKAKEVCHERGQKIAEAQWVTGCEIKGAFFYMKTEIDLWFLCSK